MNFTPEKDYEGLLLQAKAMHRIIEAMEKSKSIQGKAVDDLTRQLLICGKDHLESEREANRALTDQVLKLEQENDQLKSILQGVEKSDYRFSVEQLAEHDDEMIDNFISDVAQCTYMALDIDEDYEGDAELVVNFVALQNRAKRLTNRGE